MNLNLQSYRIYKTVLMDCESIPMVYKSVHKIYKPVPADFHIQFFFPTMTLEGLHSFLFILIIEKHKKKPICQSLLNISLAERMKKKNECICGKYRGWRQLSTSCYCPYM